MGANGRLGLALCALVGCGRIGFDAQEIGGDGSATIDGAPTIDATPGPDVVASDAAPLGSFSTPVTVDALSDPVAFDADVTLRSDGLEVFFSSTRSGGVGSKDIWTSTRMSPTAQWSPPFNVLAVNSTQRDSGMTLSSDGRTMWLASDRNGGELDLFVTTRPALGADWGTPVIVTELATACADRKLAVDETDLVAYTEGYDPACAQEADIVLTQRADTSSPWQTRVPVAELSTAARESNPTITPDALYMVFSSDRATASDQDLYEASRASVSDPFDTPTVIPNLSEPLAWDDDPWISPDRRTIFFASNRNGGGQQFDIFMATR